MLKGRAFNDAIHVVSSSRGSTARKGGARNKSVILLLLSTCCKSVRQELDLSVEALPLSLRFVFVLLTWPSLKSEQSKQIFYLCGHF